MNHNACSIFLRIHMKCESMEQGTKEHFTFARAFSEWTLHTFHIQAIYKHTKFPASSREQNVILYLRTKSEKA